MESGNGRTIARAGAAQTGDGLYDRYLAELKAQGFPFDGMKQPIVVRMRSAPMTGAGSRRHGRRTEQCGDGGVERRRTGQADARKLDAPTLAILRGDNAAARDRFARAFLGRVASDQMNEMVGEDGKLSLAGQERIDAALMAKAYGDQRLVEAIFEKADSNVKTIGYALKEAAPAWAEMRAAGELGTMAPEMDITAALKEAVGHVRHARDNRLNLSEEINERLARGDIFNGRAISAHTEQFLRLFFRDDDFKLPRAKEDIAQVMKGPMLPGGDRESLPEPGLFGDGRDESTASQTFQRAYDEYVANKPAKTSPPAGPPTRPPLARRPRACDRGEGRKAQGGRRGAAGGGHKKRRQGRAGRPTTKGAWGRTIRRRSRRRCRRGRAGRVHDGEGLHLRGARRRHDDAQDSAADAGQ